MKKMIWFTLLLGFFVITEGTGVVWAIEMQKMPIQQLPSRPQTTTTTPQTTTPPYKIVFITSKQYPGNLGGVSGGNAICQSLAQAAGLAGTFKAWLSPDNRMESPANTFTRSTVPYKLRDGRVVAENWAALISGTGPLTVINITETGARAALPVNYGSYTYVWTGTGRDGYPYGAGCNSWMHRGDAAYPLYGTVGFWDDLTKWSGCSDYRICQALCNTYARLYCFQQ